MPKMDIGQVKLHFNVHGEGEPVVLITGLGGDLTFWKGLVPLLSPEFKVVCFDPRGAGLTESPDSDFSMSDLADDVAGMMDGLGIEKAHIVGWSMGGNVAQDLAARHSDRVGCLTLISTYTRRPARSSYAIDTMIRMVREGARYESLFMMMQAFCMTEASFKAREKRLPGPKEPLTFAADSIDGFARQKKALDGFDGSAMLERITMPTLILHGTDDIMVPPQYSEELSQGIKGSRLENIEGAGHIINPRLYHEKLQAFISANPLRNGKEQPYFSE
ncbi:MAG: alpha/beta hydrolase [Euryarchaeota archaeon]|nr:alpha/beta hydrolase [Euryarchaeota archaeon]